MLGLILDAAVIMLIIFAINKGQELNWGPAIICSLAIGLASALCVVFLGPSLGVFALVPILPIAILAIWMISGIPLGMASVAGVVFVAYKIAMLVGLSALMS